MRTSIIMLALVAVCLIPGILNAMTITPYINPGFFWSDGSAQYLAPSWPFAVEIRIDNPDATRFTMSLPLCFYGTDDLTGWELVDKGGDLVPNIVMTNGFEYNPYPNPWFNYLDSIFLIDWDGQLADTMNFTGIGGQWEGMPMGEPLETRLVFWFRPNGEGTFCMDSCSIPDRMPPGQLDWMFLYPSPSFGGPYCWEVKKPVCGKAGDLNNDMNVNILDATYLVNYLYREGPRPASGGDLDCNGRTNILDASFLIDYLYKNGSPPASC